MSTSPSRASICFTISLLVLFLELACIRWFPAHVLFLTFFTNTVLLACFLGMSVGCLAANRPRLPAVDAPAAGLWRSAGAHLVEWAAAQAQSRSATRRRRSSCSSASSTSCTIRLDVHDPDRRARAGLVFVLIALAMVGPGQESGVSLLAAQPTQSKPTP